MNFNFNTTLLCLLKVNEFNTQDKCFNGEEFGPNVYCLYITYGGLSLT